MWMTQSAAFGAALLEPDEEQAAIVRWQRFEDRDALEVLMRAHARLAWSQARRWTDNPTHLEDLVAAGMIGLVRAASNFDLTRDVRYATYATWWVRNEIATALSRVRTVIDIPFRSRDAASPDKTIICVSGDAGGPDDELGLLESVASEEPNPEECVLSQSSLSTMRNALLTALADLPEREANVIYRRRLSESGESLSDIAAAFAITPAQVRQVETRALSLLRDTLVARGFSLSVLH